MRRFGSGLVDAAASSMATFAAGVFAARYLDLGELGAYALVFSAIMLTTQLPTQGVLIPVEARLISFERHERIGHLGASLRTAAPWSLGAAGLTMSVGLLIPETVSASSTWMIAGTGAVATFFSPLQDHARRMLHLAGLHDRAAVVSVARVLVVLVSLVGGIVLGAENALVPLGALALGDALSIVIGISAGRVRHPLPFRSDELARSGSWLLAGSLAAPTAGFLVSLVVTRLAGEDALGLAEAARVAAQPLFVLGLGLAAVLGPDAMEAARDGNRREAGRMTLRLVALLGVVTAVYLPLTLLPPGVNPLVWVIPRAFDQVGLAQLSILAAAVNAAVFLQRSELVVLNRARGLAGAELASGSLRTLISVGAGVLHAWVVPLGLFLAGVARVMLFTRLLGQRSRTERPGQPA